MRRQQTARKSALTRVLLTRSIACDAGEHRGTTKASESKTQSEIMILHLLAATGEEHQQEFSSGGKAKILTRGKTERWGDLAGTGVQFMR